jgi:transcriptional regulator GlxA family with amidase domain
MGNQIDKIYAAEGFERMLQLLRTLSEMAACKDLQLLSSLGFQPDLSEGEKERIHDIYEFTLQHFRQPIYLEEVSQLVGLVPNSFCRYFKSRTGKTYSQFVTEIRVGHACKLLIDNHISIKQVCFESGFNNFTSFNQSFKKITGKVPQAYQRAFAG